MLEAANASGAVGPNLDEAQPDHALVVDRVTNGPAVMPPFGDQLSEQQIQDVAAYVVASTAALDTLRSPGEVSERPKERDWKSRTRRKACRGFKSRPLR